MLYSIKVAIYLANINNIANICPKFSLYKGNGLKQCQNEKSKKYGWINMA